jgi:hypothetical protein
LWPNFFMSHIRILLWGGGVQKNVSRANEFRVGTESGNWALPCY